MIDRRTLLKALVIGTAVAFPIARLTMKDNPERHTHVRFRMENSDKYWVAGTDLVEEVENLAPNYKYIKQWDLYTPEDIPIITNLKRGAAS